MVRLCIIPSCEASHSSFNEQTGNKIHDFPKPIKNYGQRVLWIAYAQNCGAADYKIQKLENYGICSRHFTQDSFDFFENRKLRANAYPAVYPANTVSVVPFAVLDLAQRLMEAENQVKSRDDMIDYLQKKIGELEKEKSKLTEELIESRVAARAKEYKLQSKYPEGFCSGLFSDNQCSKWTEMDIIKALPLHLVSPKAYECARVSMQVPLPCPTILKNHLAKIEIMPDVPFPFVFNVINNKFADVPSRSLTTHCVIAVDEMAISQNYVYDKALDQIFGGEPNVTLWSVRGLFSAWKTPLMYAYDTTLEDLYKLISLLEENMVTVRGVVSDCGPKNQGLWRDLKIGKMANHEMVQSSFRHPDVDREIYWFPDPCHLIKCLRNSFMDRGIRLWDGTEMDQSLLVELVQLLDGHELRCSETLRPKHLFVRGQQRQEVRPAYQVFSHTTATLIRIFLKHREGYERVAEFFELVNDFFDLVNVRRLEDTDRPTKSPFGLHIEAQLALVQRAKFEFAHMKIGNGRIYQPFQRGLVMFCENLVKLYDSMENVQGFQYILTKNLNQDYQENFFSQARGYGGFKMNPDGVEVKYRMRKLAFQCTVGESLEDFRACTRPLVSEVTNVDDRKARIFATESYCVTREELKEISPELDMDIEFSLLEDAPDKIVLEGGREYVAGYIARKLYESHPALCTHGANEPSREYFVDALSNGGLTEPSKMWFALFRKFEEYFECLHPNSTANKSRFIVKQLIDLISEKHDKIPTEIIAFYAKVRTGIRVKHLNKLKQDEKFKRQRRGDPEEIIEEEQLSESSEQVLNSLEAKMASMF